MFHRSHNKVKSVAVFFSVVLLCCLILILHNWFYWTLGQIVMAICGFLLLTLCLKNSRFLWLLIRDCIYQPPALCLVLGPFVWPMIMFAQLKVQLHKNYATQTRPQRLIEANKTYGVVLSTLKIPHKTILGSSALQLGRLLFQGRCTSEQLTAFFLHRIETENYLLNAVVHLRVKKALRDARARDAIIRCERERCKGNSGTVSRLPPFFGVPTVTKECMEFEGMPYSAGIFGRRNAVGKSPATVMHRLEWLGGFVILGSTNTSEACMWMEV